jgi:hypothetical protein
LYGDVSLLYYLSCLQQQLLMERQTHLLFYDDVLLERSHVGIRSLIHVHDGMEHVRTHASSQ